MQITLLATLIMLLVVALLLFSRFYRHHMQGENAPEKQAQVTILDKQSIAVDNPFIGEDDQEFWIYVQKGRLGPKREFQVGAHYFHSINPGDKGILTYRGTQFIHFSLQR
ncbi:DUF2500 domain-containing protein [Vibrio diazotrophicus]|uniref:DUF2500 domain-containing protein n=1 Tax=Vibrio diazotrophicus TaxID=685 RepID=A0A2J8I1H4_VIBDI|nr:DUF2500 domain-containing protein [Vibrio diazotrophicus]PNI00993.1 DUF2500 domain-containing protein [Vibrio diazotrophicus]PNI04389.1 DUF2500 domain-containing protein [Vibrio diazotrophicus]